MRYIGGSHGTIVVDEKGWFQHWHLRCNCSDCKEFPGYDEFHYDLMEYDHWAAKYWPDLQPEGKEPDHYIDVVLIASITADGLYEPADAYSRELAIENAVTAVVQP